jgi:hypothetical protein
MIDVANKNVSRLSLLLEMAFQAKRLVPRVQHSLIDRAVRRMTNHATLAERFVLINKRAALDRVALETGLVLTKESEAAALQCLLHIGSPTLDRKPDMRVMTIRATHSALEHRMAVRKLKLCPHFQVTLETSLGRLPRVDDGVIGAPAVYMQTAGAMA